MLIKFLIKKSNNNITENKSNIEDININDNKTFNTNDNEQLEYNKGEPDF